MNFRSPVRWILFGFALIAILGIAGMNIYYFNQFQENSQSILIENKKEQVSEFSFEVRHRFLNISRKISKVDMTQISYSGELKNAYPEQLLVLLKEVRNDALFTDMYLLKPQSEPCNGDSIIQMKEDGSLEIVSSYPEVVCDGIGLAKTRMKVLQGDYKWTTKTIFDTHRSMNVALIDPNSRSIVGYVTMLINSDYLLNEVMKPKLVEAFGSESESGVNLWVYDWVRGEVLVTNNDSVEYNRQNIDYFDKFPSMFDNWSIRADVQEQQQLAGIERDFIRNMLILGLAVFVLLGSLVFFIVTAQRERQLAMRQSTFLSNVTHELKTPLAVIQAAGENLRDGRVTNQERLSSYGKHVYDEAVRLKKMINKLLDVARSDAQQLQARTSPQQIDALVHNYLENHAYYLEQKGFTIRTQLKTNNALCMIDPDQFETILENLIENAIKYSFDSKEIIITTEVVKKELKIHVRDFGIGIPDSEVSHIFDKFYRVEDSLTAQTKGHGLGLSIVKDLTELNNGTISVESEYQQGSVFTVTFPVNVMHTENGVTNPVTATDNADTKQRIYVN